MANAGIGDILYPSKFTKKKCLAIYPQNFDSEDYIAVDGDTPDSTVSPLDGSTLEQPSKLHSNIARNDCKKQLYVTRGRLLDFTTEEDQPNSPSPIQKLKLVCEKIIAGPI